MCEHVSKVFAQPAGHCLFTSGWKYNGEIKTVNLNIWIRAFYKAPYMLRETRWSIFAFILCKYTFFFLFFFTTIRHFIRSNLEPGYVWRKKIRGQSRTCLIIPCPLCPQRRVHWSSARTSPTWNWFQISVGKQKQKKKHYSAVVKSQSQFLSK